MLGSTHGMLLLQAGLANGRSGWYIVVQPCASAQHPAGAVSMYQGRSAAWGGSSQRPARVVQLCGRLTRTNALWLRPWSPQDISPQNFEAPSPYFWMAASCELGAIPLPHFRRTLRR